MENGGGYMHTKIRKNYKKAGLLFLIWAVACSLIACSADRRGQDETEQIVLEIQQDGTIEPEQDINKSHSDKKDSSDESEGCIWVYVCGAVKQEGVYKLPSGSRVYEAIELAGGLLPEAAATQINQAEILKDEQQVYIPTQEEVREQLATQSEEPDGRIDLNRAGKDILMNLPGIGESKAESILQYREKNGDFQSIEEIMMIPGIKEGLFNQIKDKIKVQ